MSADQPRRSVIIVSALALAAAPALAGCLGGDTVESTFYVKDAPTDEFDEIWVGFSEVEVHHGDDDEWITTVDERRSVDLLTFDSDDAQAFLGSEGIPTGQYTQIRIHVDEAWGIDAGNNETITVSSQTAMVNRPWTVEDNGTTPQVTIDLNLDRSLTDQGNQGWRMTPVIGSVQVDYVDDDPMQDRGRTTT